MHDRLSYALELYPQLTAADQIITYSRAVLTLKFTPGSKGLCCRRDEGLCPKVLTDYSGSSLWLNIIVKSFKECCDPLKTMCLLTLYYYYCLGDKINVRCLFKSLELSIKLKRVSRPALFMLLT